MKMIEIRILNKKTIEYQDWKVDEYKIYAPRPLTSFYKYAGVDSGSVNLGISLLYSDSDGEDKAILWQIKLVRDDNPINRILLARQIIQFTLNFHAKIKLATIENAAYAKGFRQVELAEQRASIALSLINISCKVQMIAPMTIRKEVFGSGKIKAHEAWQLEGIPKNKQPNDALAALSCAYYGMIEGE